MQIINLAVKLLLTNPEQTHALAHYVFFMAKFDTNYDIRDKARAIRFLLPPQNVFSLNLSLNSFFSSFFFSHNSNTKMKIFSEFTFTFFFCFIDFF
jgi:hypothetical protein